MVKRLTLLALPLFASAQMNITTLEQVEMQIKPDVLRGNIGFEEQGKNENTIKEHFNAIVAAVKKYDPDAKMCQGGGYYLSPQYSYKDQKREFIGYTGSLNFGCEFNEIKPYNGLNAAIDPHIAPSVRKNQGALAWGVSRIQEQKVKNALRSELLRKAAEQTREFSKETGMACSVSAVNFSGVSRPVVMMAKGMNMMASAPTESPIVQDETIQLEATVDYLCAEKL